MFTANFINFKFFKFFKLRIFKSFRAPRPAPPAVALEDGCRRAQEVLSHSWVRKPGYTSPNLDKYPWQWLWDSCFHAIAWSCFGSERSVIELESLFKGQLASGFMPNMIYHCKPWTDWWKWRVSGHSTITQPPMYGHALKVLHERGFAVDHLLPAADRAIKHLIESRLDETTGLVKIVHPWESGCDDSPRWRAWMGTRSGYRRSRWNITKYLLLRAMRVEAGEALSSRRFEVCAASFNALVAFNAIELGTLTGDDELVRMGRKIARRLEAAWQPDSRTWADLLPGGQVSSAVPTLEALLPLLVVENEEQKQLAFAELMSERSFKQPFGFAGVAVSSPLFKRDGYWTGGSWPQLCYLFFIASCGAGSPQTREIAGLSVKGILQSGLCEFFDSIDGRGLGAHPQSWAAIVVELLAALNEHE